MRFGRFIVRISAWPSRSTSRSGMAQLFLFFFAALQRRVHLRIVLQRLGQRRALAEIEHALGVGEHVRVVARQPSRPARCTDASSCAVGHHAVDEPDAQRRVGVDHLAPRAPARARARVRPGAAAGAPAEPRQDAELREGEAQRRALGGDAQVEGQRHRDADADRRAVERAQRRLRALRHLEREARDELALRDARALGLVAQRLEVDAGAEGAAAAGAARSRAPRRRRAAARKASSSSSPIVAVKALSFSGRVQRERARRRRTSRR